MTPDTPNTTRFFWDATPVTGVPVQTVSKQAEFFRRSVEEYFALYYNK